MKIDGEITYTKIIEMWKAGEKVKVINILASDHAGLTALVIVQGAQNKTLTISDANEITNLLMDRRQTEYLYQELKTS